MEIKKGEPVNIPAQKGSKGTINSCKVDNEAIVEVFGEEEVCGVTGLQVGTTTLTVTGVEPDSTSETTIVVE